MAPKTIPTPLDVQRAISARDDETVLSQADGYVRGEVPRTYLEEAVKASSYAATEAAALQLAEHAEAAGLGVRFFVDEYDTPGDVDLRVEGACTLMVRDRGLGPFVIEGVGGWEQPDPSDARHWRRAFQEMKEALDAS